MDTFLPDWAALTRLRQNFVKETISDRFYWKSLETLYQYDSTFAQRIGWKWDSVLREVIRQSNFDLGDPVQVIDWGCGTGIASRKFLSFFGAQRISELALWDQSELARKFAEKKLKDSFPELKIETNFDSNLSSDFILLISHVLNELSDGDLKELFSLMRKARAVFWVEPGTPQSSQLLIQFRESLKDNLLFILPCTHQNTCGLFEKKSQDWCHFFATPPNSIFQDPFWEEFSKKMRIDLRSLPVSYWVGISKSLKTSLPYGKRLLGRARHYKGYSLALTCDESGIREEKLLQRDKKEVIDILKEKPFHFNFIATSHKLE